MLIDFPQTEVLYQEVIDAIHQFSTSTHFFYWLGKDTIQVEVILEKLHEDMYERIMEYSLDGLKIFSVGGHIKLPCINQGLRDRMNSDENIRMKKFFFFDYGKFHAIVPELAQLEKKELSHTREENTYTVISQLYFQKSLSGTIWEIYELPNLAKVYLARKASLKPAKN